MKKNDKNFKVGDKIQNHERGFCIITKISEKGGDITYHHTIWSKYIDENDDKDFFTRFVKGSYIYRISEIVNSEIYYEIY